jgi:toxin ParE1/3/4
MKEHWPARSRRQLARALDWYIEQSPRVAVEFNDEVESVVDELLEAPERWPLWRPPALRYYTLQRFPYRLFYRCDGDTLTVVAFVHQRRHPARFP